MKNEREVSSEFFIEDSRLAQEYHDDMTMVKVHEAIQRCFDREGGAPPSASDIINELQNAGILFRERAK